jgi:tetratricopeptide (TPR) repeat protein
MQVALEQALELRKGKADFEGVKQLLKHKAKVQTEAGDRANLIPTLHELAELYLRNFRRLDQAIAVLESAHEVDPDNEARQERLAELYSRDPTRYLDKAVAAHAGVLRYDPYRPETYKALRKLYTTAKRPDSSWCVCQALVVLNAPSRTRRCSTSACAAATLRRRRTASTTPTGSIWSCTRTPTRCSPGSSR